MKIDFRTFDFEAIRAEALALYDQHNLTGVRISGTMPQDSLEYWIAVVAWQRANRNIGPAESFPRGQAGRAQRAGGAERNNSPQSATEGR
jgi:hypothetical protein